MFYVLQILSSKVNDLAANLVPHLVKDWTRDANLTRFSQWFKAERYVDSVTENVPIAIDNVTQMNTDTHGEQPFRAGDAGRCFLNVDCALHGSQSTRKFDQ
jgi:hypothetical protein